MGQIIQLSGTILVLLVAYQLLNLVRSRRNYSQKMRPHGCQEPPKYPPQRSHFWARSLPGQHEQYEEVQIPRGNDKALPGLWSHIFGEVHGQVSHLHHRLEKSPDIDILEVQQLRR